MHLSCPALTNANLFKRLTSVYKDLDFGGIKDLNAEYVIIRKDIYGAPYVEDINEFRRGFIESDIGRLLIDNAYLELYKVKEEYYASRLILEKNEEALSFTYISPVKYLIQINGIRGKEQLSFLESYSKHWKIYPLGFEFDNSVDNILSESQYLYKKSVFDSSHRVIYDYANSWTIDSEYIKQNYSEKYYKENADGSISVKLILYFKPQSYFYLGVLVSGTTLLACLSYLGYDRIKKKKDNLL